MTKSRHVCKRQVPLVFDWKYVYIGGESDGFELYLRYRPFSSMQTKATDSPGKGKKNMPLLGCKETVQSTFPSGYLFGVKYDDCFYVSESK